MLAINQVLELNNLIKAAQPGSPLYKLPPVVDPSTGNDGSDALKPQFA
jgi:hypothetical protein